MKKEEIIVRLKNCFDDVCELTVDVDNVQYIFKQTLSNDEIAIVVYKDNSVAVFDSDMHGRCISYAEDMEMIYPEQIDLYGGCFYNPNERDEFKLIKEEEK